MPSIRAVDEAMKTIKPELENLNENAPLIFSAAGNNFRAGSLEELAIHLKRDMDEIKPYPKEYEKVFFKGYVISGTLSEFKDKLIEEAKPLNLSECPSDIVEVVKPGFERKSKLINEFVQVLEANTEVMFAIQELFKARKNYVNASLMLDQMQEYLPVNVQETWVEKSVVLRQQYPGLSGKQ